MIVELSSGGTSATANIWKQDRFIIKFTANSAGMTVLLWTNRHGSVSSPLAKYTADADGMVYIDMSDYIRTYVDGTSVTSLTITVYDVSSTTSTVVGYYKGLIDPANVIIPPHELAAYIVPPSLMYIDGTQNDTVKAELYATDLTNYTVSGDANLATNKRYIGRIEGDFTLSRLTASESYSPKTFACDVRYGLVRWTSLTGTTRAHYMEVCKPTISTKDNYSLLRLDNEYEEMKGRTDGLTLRLTGLNAYDVWYYSDVLTSGRVELSLDEGTTWVRVQITNKSVTIPDGEAIDGKVELQVNWRRYDAINM